MEDKMQQMNGIGERLSVCRQNRKMTQEELANRLGITPQALSKWERGISFPDVLMLADLAKVLEVSTDYILGAGTQVIAENGDEQVQNIIWNNLRDSLEPLELIFGKDLVPLFMDDRYKDRIVELRKKLSKEGILMPIVRVRDEARLGKSEFMILSYQRILCCEKKEDSEQITLDYMLVKLEEAVRDKYFEILSPDIIKSLTDNLKIKYPALIEGIIPQKITYGLLNYVMKRVLQKGGRMLFLPKIIEIADSEICCNPNIAVEELADRIMEELEPASL